MTFLFNNSLACSASIYLKALFKRCLTCLFNSQSTRDDALGEARRKITSAQCVKICFTGCDVHDSDLDLRQVVLVIICFTFRERDITAFPVNKCTALIQRWPMFEKCCWYYGRHCTLSSFVLEQFFKTCVIFSKSFHSQNSHIAVSITWHIVIQCLFRKYLSKLKNNFYVVWAVRLWTCFCCITAIFWSFRFFHHSFTLVFYYAFTLCWLWSKPILWTNRLILQKLQT